MKKLFHAIIPFLLFAALLFAEGCANKEMPAPEPQSTAISLPYNMSALRNYSLSREYIATGRYELAKEHLLLALASVEREELRNRLTLDIAAVDRLIRTTR